VPTDPDPAELVAPEPFTAGTWDELIAALDAATAAAHEARLEVAAEATERRQQVKAERRARRWQVAGLVVALLAVAGLGIAREVDRSAQTDRDLRQTCLAANDARAAIRDAFGSLVEQFAPPGAEARPRADAYLASLEVRLPARECP
jgi:hypothetical protein